MVALEICNDLHVTRVMAQLVIHGNHPAHVSVRGLVASTMHILCPRADSTSLAPAPGTPACASSWGDQVHSIPTGVACLIGPHIHRCLGEQGIHLTRYLLGPWIGPRDIGIVWEVEHLVVVLTVDPRTGRGDGCCWP